MSSSEHPKTRPPPLKEPWDTNDGILESADSQIISPFSLVPPQGRRRTEKESPREQLERGADGCSPGNSRKCIVDRSGVSLLNSWSYLDGIGGVSQERESMRRAQNSTNRDELVYFGYRPVTEAEKVKLVQRHFDTVARMYDLMNTILSFGLHHLWKRKAIQMIGLRPGDRVIDICGGTADLTILAARAVGTSGWVILYDFNRSMMEAGRSKVDKSPFAARIVYVQGDAEELSVADRSFDVVTVGFGVRNLTHIDRGFQEMYRVLKPGGKLMCLEFSLPSAFWFRWLYHLYSFSLMPILGRILVGSWEAYTYLPESIRMFPQPEELTAILEKTGFSQITHRKLTNGIAVIHLAIKP